MQPLSAFAEGGRRAIRGVLTDIDETLTTGGTLTAEAYGALERLHDAGLICVPITGRAAGWCDLAIDLEASREEFVFIGDSPNDAAMFAAFPNAVGVANVADFADRIETLPAYVTTGRAGAGFAELADALLAVR